jgi:hypothetical protein
MKHRNYRLLELRATGFINAAGIHPQVFQTIFGSLFSTELDLVEPGRLALSISLHQVFETDLFVVG